MGRKTDSAAVINSLKVGVSIGTPVVNGVANLLANSQATTSNVNSRGDVEVLLETQGLGLHSGKTFQLRIRQAPGGSGVIFRVRHSAGDCTAPALWTRLSGTTRSTALVLRGPKAKVEIRTIEHLMAAIHVMGLRDLDIEISLAEQMDGSGDVFPEVFEIPVLDGSSLEWMKVLQPLRPICEARNKIAHIEAWLICKEICVQDQDRLVRLRPFNNGERKALSKFKVDVDYGPTLKQRAEFEIQWLNLGASMDEFMKCFAGARTFGFQHELENLKARGLALGGRLENAILIDGDRIVNEGGFRIPNELAAHKLVDAVGDLSLLGAPVLGHIDLVKAGHSMHFRALKEAVDEEALLSVRILPNGQIQ